jgi:hypothetical protein
MKLCICTKCHVDRIFTQSKSFEKENLNLVKSIANVVPFETLINRAIEFAKRLETANYYAGSYTRMGLQSTWVIENSNIAYLLTQNASGEYNFFKLNLKDNTSQSIKQENIPQTSRLYFNNIEKSNQTTYSKKICSQILAFQWTPHELKILNLSNNNSSVYSSSFRFFPCDTLLAILRLYQNFNV